ncbi:MAG: 1-acyl-sn-glycerol-3-phosphate acyltransferase [Polyangiaceae bacterium]|nr:1-acyl-sn-glycerol-3-phosphate acyltransferase [Polyangiaceae bacterium]
MGQAPIFGFNDHREEIVREVVRRVVSATRDPLHVLNDAAYHETKRLETARRPDDVKEREEWRTLARSLGRMGDGERKQRLTDLTERYAWDVAGNFNPRVYTLSKRLLPPIVTALLQPTMFVRKPGELLSLDVLRSHVTVQGPIQKIQRLVENGTAVFVPTHLSNFDSIVFGYALEAAGLPPATYGAGKNLFTNPVLSFFMHNLGAYRVDRRLRHNLYKDILKTYSCVLLEQGYHSLFFPGGTRSRSGGIERRLKLGLVGSAVEAYARTLLTGKERRIYFVPATINYLITLEAETLIADYLSEAGKGRFIIEDDESSRFERLFAFTRKLFDMRGSVVIRFGEPIDPFGNAVDDVGDSHDSRGRRVDPASYVKDRNGNVTLDAARDTQYTRELGDAICAAYARDTVAMSTHVTAAVAFARLRQISPAPDLFTVLRQRDVLTVPRDELASDVAMMRDKMRQMESAGQVRLGDLLRNASGGDIVERAVRAFAGYHTTRAVEPRSTGIALCDPNLLFYYQNRLAAHGLGWDQIAPPGMLPAVPVQIRPTVVNAGQGPVSAEASTERSAS